MLYIVGTPIGNIEDTSLRAVKTLIESDVILAEDTASFDIFYNRVQKLFGLKPTKKQQFIHFHKENEFEKTSHAIELLQQELMVSLVSESGLPLISDPGHMLITQVVREGLQFTVIPGPTAFTTAALLSGFSSKQILFLGFLPKKTSDIVHLFKQINTTKTKDLNPTIVFYESPHRIEATLTLIKEQLPHAEVAITRELTKKFEEVIRSKASDLEIAPQKGEVTIVLKVN